MLKMLVFALALLSAVMVPLYYLLFAEIDRTDVAIRFSAGFLLMNMAVVVSGFKLMRFGEDAETAAGFSLAVFGAILVLFIFISSLVGLLLHRYVNYMLSLQAALTLLLLALRVHLWFGFRGLLSSRR
jgi:peptidoglycan/LPS O-acetylase OafA/YrhL